MNVLTVFRNTEWYVHKLWKLNAIGVWPHINIFERLDQVTLLTSLAPYRLFHDYQVGTYLKLLRLLHRYTEASHSLSGQLCSLVSEKFFNNKSSSMARQPWEFLYLETPLDDYIIQYVRLGGDWLSRLLSLVSWLDFGPVPFKWYDYNA